MFNLFLLKNTVHCVGIYNNDYSICPYTLFSNIWYCQPRIDFRIFMDFSRERLTSYQNYLVWQGKSNVLVCQNFYVLITEQISRDGWPKIVEEIKVWWTFLCLLLNVLYLFLKTRYKKKGLSFKKKKTL